MGCFLSCFRGGSGPSGDLHDPLVRESRLGDAFLNDEKKFDEVTGKLDVVAANGHGVDEELRREANYLKSCGTISQTPPEIQHAVSINSEGGNGCGDTPTNVQLMKDEVLLEENSIKLLNSERDVSRHEQGIDEGTLRCGDTPTNVQLMEDAVLLKENTSELLNSEGDVSRHEHDEGALKCVDTPTNVQLMKDAVLLEENSSELLNSDQRDVSRHEQGIDECTLRVGSETQSSLEDKPLYQNVRDQSTDSADSPYPTPLVLRGDIQTPGTVYTAYKETLKPGKRTRASRQFIHPVLRPIENKMQWMELKAESPVLSSNPPKRRNLSADSSEKAQQAFASSTDTETESSEYVSFPNYDSSAAQNEVMSPDEPKGQNATQQQYQGEELPEQSSEYGKPGVTSLSHWLKPSSAGDESNGSSPDDGNIGKETWYETSVSDVPIFPAFALNWETDNPTPVLPKEWDGNGIPNTTTKYKEDQKVSWHATPFEERLLKVLSDDKPHHERKLSGKLIHLEENAE